LISHQLPPHHHTTSSHSEPCTPIDMWCLPDILYYETTFHSIQHNYRYSQNVTKDYLWLFLSNILQRVLGIEHWNFCLPLFFLRGEAREKSYTNRNNFLPAQCGGSSCVCGGLVFLRSSFWFIVHQQSWTAYKYLFSCIQFIYFSVLCRPELSIFLLKERNTPCLFTFSIEFVKMNVIYSEQHLQSREHTVREKELLYNSTKLQFPFHLLLHSLIGISFDREKHFVSQ